ncbi:MAG: site-2 protease family protein, partial [Thermoanaerobaculia bacterium]
MNSTAIIPHVPTDADDDLSASPPPFEPSDSEVRTSLPGELREALPPEAPRGEGAEGEVESEPSIASALREVPFVEDAPMKPAGRVRHPLMKFLSGAALTLTIVLLKLKAVVFIAVDYLRSYAVNPFEGFGITQFAVAGASMALSIAAYATKAPLPLVVGFVLIIFVHELGHALVIRAKGLRAGMMVFIPFIGGAVTLKDQPRSAFDDAQIGLAGPVAGTFAALVSLQIFKWTLQPLYLAVAAAGFAINLLNLLPIGMLDGGRISAAVTKWMWLFGGGWLIYKVVKQPNPLMLLILV